MAKLDTFVCIADPNPPAPADAITKPPPIVDAVTPYTSIKCPCFATVSANAAASPADNILKLSAKLSAAKAAFAFAAA